MSDQSANNKRIAKNTLMLYVRMLLTMGVSLYTSRVILNTLGVEDFGIYGVVGGVIWMFSFITNSMSGATQRFLTFELGRGNSDKLQKVFNMSLEIYVILALLILVLGETIGLWFVMNKLTIPAERMSAVLWVYQASIVTCMVTIITIPYNAVIISHEKMSAFAYISIYEVLAKLGVVYLLLLFSFDKLKLYAILILAVQISICLIYQIYSARKFTETKLKLFWDKELFRNMTGFAGWTLFGNVACVCYTQGLNIVMNMFFGPVVNAARAVAAQVEGVVNGFVSNFQTALNPQIVKIYAAKEMKQMHTLIFASCRYSFFLLFALGLPIYIEAPTILEIWLKTVPVHTVNFLRITMLALLVNTQANPMITAAGATGKIKKYQIVLGSTLLLILPFAYLSLYLGAIPEVAMLVYFFFIVVTQILRMLMIRPMINLSIREYIKQVISKVVIVVFTSSIIPISCYILLPANLLVVFFICIISFLSVGLSIYTFGINQAERGFVNGKINQMYMKLFPNKGHLLETEIKTDREIILGTKKNNYRKYIVILLLFLSISANVLMILPYVGLVINRSKSYTQVTDSVELCQLVRNKSIGLVNKKHKAIKGYSGLPYDIMEYYQSAVDAIDNNYHKGFLLAGIMMYAEKTNDKDAINAVKSFVDSQINEQGEFNYEITVCDQAVMGISLCYLYKETKDSKYATASKQLYDFLVYQNTENGILYRSPSDKNLSDVLAMTIPFLVEYGNIFADSTALNTAYTNFNIFREHAVDKDTGMPSHGYNIVNNMKLGSINWGRGIGWYLLAASYLPDFIDEALDDDLVYINYGQYTGLQENKYDSSTALLVELYKKSRFKGQGIMFMQPHILHDGSITDMSGETMDLNNYANQFGEDELGNGLFLMLLSKYL